MRLPSIFDGIAKIRNQSQILFNLWWFLKLNHKQFSSIKPIIILPVSHCQGLINTVIVEKYFQPKANVYFFFVFLEEKLSKEKESSARKSFAKIFLVEHFSFLASVATSWSLPDASLRMCIDLIGKWKSWTKLNFEWGSCVLDLGGNPRQNEDCVLDSFWGNPRQNVKYGNNSSWSPWCFAALLQRLYLHARKNVEKLEHLWTFSGHQLFSIAFAVLFAWKEFRSSKSLTMTSWPLLADTNVGRPRFPVYLFKWKNPK